MLLFADVLELRLGTPLENQRDFTSSYYNCTTPLLASKQAVSEMRRIAKYISDEKGLPTFDVEDVVSLFAHKREEAFEGERAVRLFQFRAWILCPGTNEANAPKWAALIAAVKFLDRMEEDYFADEEFGAIIQRR